jgi:Ca2+-binding EF-hand superfamily protein
MKPAGKGGKSITSSAKVPEKKIWRAEDYQGIKLNVVEEFREIKTAFDCFDSNLSGVIDPQELGRVFLELGFKGHYNFLYLGEYEGGINLVEFVQLVTS